MQGRVPMAVLVGRVSPEPQQQAQGRGVVAGTGPVQWRGLPSVHVKARVALEEGLGPDQPACRQVAAEATLSALTARGGGHGSLGLRKERKEAVSTPAWPALSPAADDIFLFLPWMTPPLGVPLFSHLPETTNPRPSLNLIPR